jgi:hypothetical protein
MINSNFFKVVVFWLNTLFHQFCHLSEQFGILFSGCVTLWVISALWNIFPYGYLLFQWTKKVSNLLNEVGGEMCWFSYEEFQVDWCFLTVEVPPKHKVVQFHFFKWFVSDISEHPHRTHSVIWAHMASQFLSVCVWLNSMWIPCRMFWKVNPQSDLLLHASRTLWKWKSFKIWYFVYAFWWGTFHFCIPIYNLFLFSYTSRPMLKLRCISLGEHTLCRTNTISRKYWFDALVLLRGGEV